MYLTVYLHKLVSHPSTNLWIRIVCVNWICLLTTWLGKARDTTRAVSSSIHPTFVPQIVLWWIDDYSIGSVEVYRNIQDKHDKILNSSILKEGLIIERSSITLAQKIQIKSVGVKHRLIHCSFVTFIWDWY